MGKKIKKRRNNVQIPGWAWSIPLFLTMAIFIGARNISALFRSEFWAEDGTHFFTVALRDGFASLWTPVYGYHFFLERLIAYSATFLPVLWTPYIYAWGCLILNVISLCYFSRDGFYWLIPSRAQRIFVCFVFAIAPGTAEIFFNLCNLTSSLTLLAALILLEKPFRLDWARFLVLFLLLISAGQVFLLAPLVFFLWYRTRNRRYLLLFVLFALVTLVNFFGNHVAGAEAKLLNYGYAVRVPRILAENFFLRIFFAPFLGSHRAGQFMQSSTWVFWPLSLIVGGISFRWVIKRFRASREKLEILMLVYILMICSYGVIAVARSYAINQIVRESGDLMWNVRYSFLPGIAALLFWFTVLFGYASSGTVYRKSMAYVVIGVLAAHNLYHWRHVYSRSEKNWPEAATRIQRVLDLKASGSLPHPMFVEKIGVHPDFYSAGGFRVEVRP